MDTIGLENLLQNLCIEDALTKISTILSSQVIQQELVSLYADSQQECKRNNKLGMEIGMSREKDLIAVMKEYLGDDVEYNIDNTCCEDVIVLKEKISIKHCSGKRGKCSIKVKWTSDNIQAKHYIDKVLTNIEEHCNHLIIVFISPPIIEIIGISKTSIIRAIQELQEDAFVAKIGINNRGIEYSKTFMNKILHQPFFSITISDVLFTVGMCPIEKRRALLHTRRQNV